MPNLHGSTGFNYLYAIDPSKKLKNKIATTINKIFETNSSFHVKWRTTGKV